jgi:hypothetical protein
MYQSFDTQRENPATQCHFKMFTVPLLGNRLIPPKVIADHYATQGW